MSTQHDGITFVSEADFDAAPTRWIDAAGPDNEIAVYDENNEIVLMMGGTYVIPDDSGRAERQVEAVEKVVALLDLLAMDAGYRMGENEVFTNGRRAGYSLAAERIRIALETE